MSRTVADVDVEVTADTLRADVKLRRKIREWESLSKKSGRLAGAQYGEALIESASNSLSRMSAAVAPILALSGATMFQRINDHVMNTIKNLDVATTQWAAYGTVLSGVGTIALSTAGALTSLAVSGSEIVGLGLLLPAVGGAFATLKYVMSSFSNDLDKVAPNVYKGFKQIQTATQLALINGSQMADMDNYIGKLRDLAMTWIPAVATAMGSWVAATAQALTTGRGLEAFVQYFSNMRDAITKMAPGVADLVSALIQLAAAGSVYFDTFADFFNRTMETFREWVEMMIDTGKFFDVVDRGILTFQAFLSVATGVWGIIRAIGTAALQAGGPDMAALARGLHTVSDILSTPLWQGTMVTLFKGAFDALGNLLPGITALGDALHSISPVLAEIMGLGTQVVSKVFEALAEVLEHPAFQRGLVDFFEGVLKGITSLVDVAPLVANKLGALLELMGTMAEVMGETLAGAWEAFGPIIHEVMEALEAVIPVLGEGFMRAVQAVAPVIADVVRVISEWVQQNPELAGTILAVAGVAGTLAANFGLIFVKTLPLLSAFLDMTDRLGFLDGAFRGLIRVIGRLAGPIAIAVGVITLLVTAFIDAWNNSEKLREAFGRVWERAGELGEKFGELFEAISDFVTDSDGVIQQVLVPAFEFLSRVVEEVFTYIGKVIAEAIDVIIEVLDILILLLKGDFTGSWEQLAPLIEEVWGLIKEIVLGAIDAIGGILNGFAEMLAEWGLALWNEFTEGTAASWSEVWEGIQAKIGEMLDGLREWGSSVNEWGAQVWEGVKDSAAQWWENISTGLTDWLTGMIEGFLGFNEQANATWEEFWGSLGGRLAEVWEVLIVSVQDGLGLVGEWIATKWEEMSTATVEGVQTAMTSIGEFFLGLGESIAGFLQAILENVVTWIDEFMSQFSFWEEMKELAAVAWSELQLTISNTTEQISEAVSGWFEGLRGMFGDWGTWLTETWNALWSGLNEWLTERLGEISTNVSNFLTGVQENWNAAWEAVLTFFREKWEGISSATSEFTSRVGETLRGWGEGISEWWNGLWSRISEWLSQKWSQMESVVGDTTGRLRATLESWGSNISSWWNGLWERVGAFLSEKWSQFSQTVSEYTSRMWETLSGWGSRVTSWWQDTWRSVGEFLSSKWEEFSSTISRYTGSIMDTFSSWGSRVWSWWTDTWRSVGEFLDSAWRGMVEAVGQWINDLLKYFIALPNDIISAMGDIVGDMRQLGANMIGGMLEGVTSKAGDLARSAAGAVKGALQAAKDAIQVRSPSRKARDQVGKPFIEGIMVGFDQLARPLQDSAADVMRQALVSAQKSVKPISLGGMGLGSPGTVRLAPPPSAYSDRPDPADRPGSVGTGDTIVIENLNITVPFEDLAQLNDLQKYAEMIEVLMRKKGIKK